MNNMPFVTVDRAQPECPINLRPMVRRILALALVAGVANAAAIETPATQGAATIAVQDGSALRVKTVHPRRGADLVMAVEQPADVLPYYQAALYAEVSGKVTFLEKDLGEAVVKGEKIAVIAPGAGSKASPQALDAPFDGVIASRNADPGTFVASAAVVPGASPLVTVERNDIVTVSARMPDRVANLINRETAAEIYLDSLTGGGPLSARIARIAPSLSPADRTIQVEVDLYNRSLTEFRDFMTRSEKEQHADLKGRQPPVFPTGLADGQSARLIPGSYGRMRLILKRFTDRSLIPTAAISRSGGLTYVYLVEKGIARKARVAIDLEDGTQVRAVLISRKDGLEQRQELADTDEIVVSNQGELEDGQPVTSMPGQW